MVYLDLAKAFDTFDHNIHIIELKELGIHGDKYVIILELRTP